jgi:N-methylhydantoinase B/oxoprolinase/acetone carboxylase alpha subunit
VVHRFGIRPDSGGRGRWKGGDGVVREIEVLQQLQVSMLSEVSTSPTASCPLTGRPTEEDQATVWYGWRRARCFGQEHVG